MMLMVILCSKKIFFVYYRSKFYKYDTFPEEVTFKLVAQGNNVENGKKKSLILSSYFFHTSF